MISVILSIIFYGILGTGVLGVGIGIYIKHGIHGLINVGLGALALPAWMFIMYRLFDNITRTMNNHLKGAGEGLFDMHFIVSIIIIVITMMSALIHRAAYLENRRKRNIENKGNGCNKSQRCF